MSDADVKAEIIRRCKRAAEAYGKARGLSASLDNLPFEHSLSLSNPALGQLRIHWFPRQRNLRVRLGDRVVVDRHENRDTELWVFTDQNDLILAALKALMVLDDLADV